MKDGRYGRLVLVGDADAMALAINKTLDSPHQAEYLREAVVEYSVHKSAGLYLDALGLNRNEKP